MTEARKLIRCSIHHLHDRLKDGTIRGIYKALPGTKRKVWRLERASFLQYARRAKSNRRLGRKPRRERNPKPYRNRGYVYVHRPDHPRAYVDGYVAEHVLVMEKLLGRPLEKKEEIHHRNGLRHDNRPENLVLYSSRSDHLKHGHGIHYRLRMRVAKSGARMTDKEKIALVDEILKSENES